MRREGSLHPFQPHHRHITHVFLSIIIFLSNTLEKNTHSLLFFHLVVRAKVHVTQLYKGQMIKIVDVIKKGCVCFNNRFMRICLKFAPSAIIVSGGARERERRLGNARGIYPSLLSYSLTLSAVRATRYSIMQILHVSRV